MGLPKFNNALFLLIIILPSLLCAGITGKITGLVVDAATNEPLIGVNIVVVDNPFGAATDVDGTFIILNLPPGTYSLQAMMMGYTEVLVKDVRVNVDKTTRVDFKLQETTLEFGESVEVTAERLLVKKDLTSSESIVGKEEIENLPVQDFTDVLNIQAGVTVDAGGAIHIRGGRANEIAYMVNGVYVNDAYSGDHALEVENNSIQELNVISGTFNAEYGQAMSGVVNIVTKEGANTFEGNIQGYFGDYVSSRDDIFWNIDNLNPMVDVQGSISGPIPGFKKLKFFASGRYYDNEGYIYGKNVFLPSDSSDFNSSDNPDDWVVMSHGQKFNYSEEAAQQAINNAESISMNKSSRLSGNLKLSYQVTTTDKVTLEGLFQASDGMDYNHEFRLNPTGIYKNDNTTFIGSTFWNHVFGALTFLDIRGSYLYTEYNQNVYDDPFDSRYVSADYLRHTGTNAYLSGGQQMWHFTRNTTTWVIKADLTSQMTKSHQLKFGGEYKNNRLEMEEFEVVPELPGRIPPLTALNNNRYVYYPNEFAAYIQDKMEYNDLVVNLGLRYDYFNPDGKIPLDFRNPANSRTRKAGISSQFSPRIGLAYSISENGKIHVSYGHFFQTPNYFYLYTNPEFEIDPLQGTTSPPPQSEANTVGNAELKPQQTIIYEIGVQQQLGSDFSLAAIGFYKDIRNLLGIEVLQNQQGAKYGRYINRDYAYARGITLEFQKRYSSLWSFSVDYTFQVARGNASDPNTAFLDAQTDPPTETVKEFVALTWDRRHQINSTIGIGRPGNYFMSFIVRYGTGLPYTPTFQNVQTSFENSGRKPDQFTTDVYLYKSIALISMKFQLFLRVFNLFDRLNEKDVFTDTGRANYTLAPLYVGGLHPRGINSLDQYFIRPEYYTEPRQIQFGLELQF